MSKRTITFRIERFKPGVVDPPRLQSFHLQVDEAMSVLDALEQIRLTLDESLMYRHSCHHSACGTCALRINGSERLACTTRVLDLESEIVVLKPLRGLERLGDLAVEMSGFYRDVDPDWKLLRRSEPLEGATHRSGEPPQRLEDCIECGCCLSSCPVTRRRADFMGPAALAALNNEMAKVSHDEGKALLDLAGSPQGERLCERAINCSRVCPTKVYPAKHIADLRRKAGGDTLNTR